MGSRTYYVTPKSEYVLYARPLLEMRSHNLNLKILILQSICCNGCCTRGKHLEGHCKGDNALICCKNGEHTSNEAVSLPNCAEGLGGGCWGVLESIGMEVYWGREGGHRWCGWQKVRKNHKKELSEMITGKDQAAWYNDPTILILWLTHFAESFEEMWSEDEANKNYRRFRNKGVTSKINFSSHNSLRGIQSIHSIHSIQSDNLLRSPISNIAYSHGVLTT